MKQKKQNALTVLLGYAGSHRRLTVLGLGLSAVSMVCSMIPYLCIWLAARDLIAVARTTVGLPSLLRWAVSSSTFWA